VDPGGGRANGARPGAQAVRAIGGSPTGHVRRHGTRQGGRTNADRGREVVARRATRATGPHRNRSGDRAVRGRAVAVRLQRRPATDTGPSGVAGGVRGRRRTAAGSRTPAARRSRSARSVAWAISSRNRSRTRVTLTSSTAGPLAAPALASPVERVSMAGGATPRKGLTHSRRVRLSVTGCGCVHRASTGVPGDLASDLLPAARDPATAYAPRYAISNIDAAESAAREFSFAMM
jgi:hypothetical protein